MALKSIPHGMIRDFLKHFILDKMNPIWFLKQYLYITQTKLKENHDISDQLTYMIESCEGVALTAELYYFDSSNHMKQDTKYSFRYPCIFSFNSLKDDMGARNK